ncbi:hypothetical protein [Intrasporangium flavum]|uniref:hypothetical protein n=1 Tax=Intrasporangium flavum TaxID=1428657 RepID=UPI00096D3F51|nr:hypothetical protein [Intrasporangium flavum]
MFAPRWLIAAGIALIAVSLGAAGHGLWWLVGLVFVLGHGRHRWEACGHQRHRDHRGDRGHRREVGTAAPTASGHVDPTTDRGPAQPDPTHDRHEAFPRR